MPAIARAARTGDSCRIAHAALCAAVLRLLSFATPGAAMPLPQFPAQDAVDSWSILADSVMDADVAETFLVRYHSTPEGVVQIAYNHPAQLLLEASLNAPVDYAQFDRQGEGFAFHFLLFPDHHEAYTLGPGRNDLQTWDQAFFNEFNYVEHAGYGLAVALDRDWPDSHYLVAVRTETADDVALKNRLWRFSVKNRDTGELELEVRMRSKDSSIVPAERLEYMREGVLTKVIENSDFREVAPGCLFPFRQEVRHYFPHARSETHTFREVQINLDLDARLFESPPLYPGARVFRHHRVNGQDIPVEDLAAAYVLPSAMPPTLEERRHAPVLTVPPQVLTSPGEQAPASTALKIPPGTTAPAEPRSLFYPLSVVVLIAVLSGISLHEMRARKP